MTSYRYKKIPKSTSFVWKIIERELGVKVLGITIRKDEVVIHFEKELTLDQKTKLDTIMLNPPSPVVVYDIAPFDLESEIEKVVGIKPVARYDIESDTGTLEFERELTSEEEKKLMKFITKLRKGRTLIRKPIEEI